jgi:hypothetical protein
MLVQELERLIARSVSSRSSLLVYMTGTTASSTQQGQTEDASTGAGPLESAQLLFGVLSAGVDDRHNCRAMTESNIPWFLQC